MLQARQGPPAVANSATALPPSPAAERPPAVANNSGITGRGRLVDILV
jgi:hypothetical protein